MKPTLPQRLQFWLSILGVSIPVCAFLLWARHREISLPGLAAALVSLLLFCLLYLRFVPRWICFWRSPAVSGSSALSSGKPPHHIEGKLFTTLLAVDLGFLLAAFLIRKSTGVQGTFLESLSFWTCTDSGHYLDIAQDWYLSQGEMDRLVQLVFLPGYPLAVRLMHLLVPNFLHAGLLISALSFAGAGCVLYRLFCLDLPPREALRTIRVLCLLPGAFFFAAPMSESLFLLLCASCLYLARTHRWLSGCLLGGLAAFTRSLGLTLIIPLLFEWIAAFRVVPKKARRRQLARGAVLFLIPGGFGVYCLINLAVAGNPFQFLIYQRVHWSQQPGWFFNTAYYQTEMAQQCALSDLHTLLGLWLPNLLASFLSLLVMTLAVRHLRPSYTAWYLAYFLIAIGATWLLSAPRYLIALIPTPLALARLIRNPTADLVVSSVSLCGSILYFYAFVLRWQVW